MSTPEVKPEVMPETQIVEETPEENKSIDFELVEESEMPNTTYSKNSKYDPILDKFIASGLKLVSVKLNDGKDANYTRTQIKKRLDIKNLNDTVIASVVNSKVYLSLKKPEVKSKVK